jgi:hypothetical protein
MPKDLAPRRPQNGAARGISNFHLPACLFQYWRALESSRQKDEEAATVLSGAYVASKDSGQQMLQMDVHCLWWG